MKHIKDSEGGFGRVPLTTPNRRRPPVCPPYGGKCPASLEMLYSEWLSRLQGDVRAGCAQRVCARVDEHARRGRIQAGSESGKRGGRGMVTAL